MANEITVKQAYKAMFVFIKRYYERKGRPGEIGALLSDLQTLGHLYGDPQREDNGTKLNTADPASWEDWLRVVDVILHEEEDKNEGV